MNINNLVFQLLENKQNISDFPLHKSIVEINNCIDSIIKKIDNDLKDLNNINLRAIVSKLLYLTSGRIGNIKSIRNHDTYGIHNLKNKHINIVKDNYAIISYIGKKQVPQKHIIKDKLTIKVLSKLLHRNNNPEDYVFSVTKIKPASPLGIYLYLNKIGFPGTPHRFRKYNSTMLFVKYITAELKNNDNIKKAYNESVLKVSQELGNTPAVCISSYIDPIAATYFFDKYDIKYPKSLENAFHNIHKQDPDGDE